MRRMGLIEAKKTVSATDATIAEMSWMHWTARITASSTRGGMCWTRETRERAASAAARSELT